MILTFSLEALAVKEFQVEADSLDEAYAILESQFAETPILPMRFEELENVNITPVDICNKDGTVISRSDEYDFYDYGWTEPLLTAIDYYLDIAKKGE